jgi:hypothetical protein
MPNTIAHFAVGGLVTRKLIPQASLPLVYLGCLVPDVPWILQRFANSVFPQVDPYQLRVYFVNQASLVSSVLLSLVIAVLFVRWKTAFAILALGSLIHLLLDACEIKWSNGVSLFVPVSWQLLRFDLFWPESIWITLLTIAGFIYIIANLKTAATLPEFCKIPWRWSLAFLLLLVWFAAPFKWMDNAFLANNHCVATLRPDRAAKRPGEPVELDRIPFKASREGGGDLVIFGGERIRAENFDPGRDAKVSIQGRFTDIDRIRVHNSHIHHSWLREVYTYVGLVFILLVWLQAPLRRVWEWVRNQGIPIKSQNQL